MKGVTSSGISRWDGDGEAHVPDVEATTTIAGKESWSGGTCRQQAPLFAAFKPLFQQVHFFMLSRLYKCSSWPKALSVGGVQVCPDSLGLVPKVAFTVSLTIGETYFHALPSGRFTKIVVVTYGTFGA